MESQGEPAKDLILVATVVKALLEKSIRRLGKQARPHVPAATLLHTKFHFVGSIGQGLVQLQGHQA